MNSRRSKYIVVALLVVAMVLAGCNKSQQATSYKALLTMQTTYNVTMSTLGDLYKQGKISEADKAKAIDYGKKFVAAYQLAVDGLAAGQNPGVNNVSIALSDLVTFVGKFTGGKT